MNILSLVMGLLLIFACTFTLSLRKATLSQGVEKTYQAHMNVSRKILNSYESLCYERMRGEATEKKEIKKTKKNSKKEEKVQTNLDCARLDLWPLVADGIEEHPELYETAAQMLRAFYAKSLFEGQQRLEYAVLNSILEAARHDASLDPNASRLHLEKLNLNAGNVKPFYNAQSIYYRMLRGTRLTASGSGYPSLLDYFSLESKKSSVCLHHASLEMLSALFGPNIASILFTQMKENKAPLTIEQFKDICTQNGKLAVSDEFINLFDLQSSVHHGSGHQTLVQQDANVCLKQKVFFPS
jgi:hypothetical protein